MGRYEPPKPRLVVENVCCGKGKQRWEQVVKEIVVLGYPRSGNTWLSRILGDLLDSPVGGLYNAKPLATEGGNRQGAHRILQLHLKPVYEMKDSVLPSAWGLCVPLWKGNPPLVHVIRDPRDVVVSAMFYWDLKDIDTALECVGAGVWPLKAHGAWADYVGSWLHVPGVHIVKYEDLHQRPFEILDLLLSQWGITVSDQHISRVLSRQEIGRKREAIQTDGESRPYGKTIQLKHLRRGVAGDWREHFTPEQEARAVGYFGKIAGSVGYEL